MNKVFVYGTLKSGFSANKRYLNPDDLLGEYKTADAFTMVGMGGYPGVIMEGNTTIIGEVYEVDDDTLSHLDDYEGHPGFFSRKYTYIPGIAEPCYIYVLSSIYLSRDKIITGEW